MADLRLNGAKLDRGERKEKAAGLAMEMARLIGEEMPDGVPGPGGAGGASKGPMRD